MLSAISLELLSDQHILTAIRKLVLTLSFNSSEVYNIIHECEYTMKDLNQIYWDSDKEKEKTRRKLRRLESRLSSLIKDVDGGSREKQRKVKVYDSKLQDAMISTYNSVVATTLNIPIVEHIVSSKWLARGPEPIDAIDNKVIIPQGYVTDILEGNRAKLALSEVLLFACLCLTTHSRAVNTLNKNLETSADKKRAQIWLDQFQKCVSSKNFHDAVLRTIIDFLRRELLVEHEKIWEAHIREFWIREGYQNRKGLNRVFEKHYLNNINDNGDDRKFVCIDQITEMGNIELICEYIFPIVELISIGVFPNPRDVKFNGDTIEMVSYLKKASFPHSIVKGSFANRSSFQVERKFYIIAAELSEFLDTLIASVVREVGQLLSCLPEAKAIEAVNRAEKEIT